MNYSIDLQAVGYDRIIWLILLFVLVAAAIVFAVFFAKINKKLKALPKKAMENQDNERTLKKDFGEGDLEYLRSRVLADIEKIARDYKNKKLNSRQASYWISITVRNFLKSATGKDADCQTYEELRMWGYISLTVLMNSLYGAEFAPDPEVDMDDCINDARKLVKQWTLHN
ncbi:MAG: hypothetical protein K6A23_05150 [Butyrivibrio sp.]|nr:hypothetical protein [Butyrivibrio sp.]